MRVSCRFKVTGGCPLQQDPGLVGCGPVGYEINMPKVTSARPRKTSLHRVATAMGMEWFGRRSGYGMISLMRHPETCGVVDGVRTIWLMMLGSRQTLCCVCVLRSILETRFRPCACASVSVCECVLTIGVSLVCLCVRTSTRANTRIVSVEITHFQEVHHEGCAECHSSD